MDAQHDLFEAHYAQLDGASLDKVEAKYAQMEYQGRELLLKEGFMPDSIVTTRHAEMRYVGQSYELEVEIPSGGELDVEELKYRFEREHLRTYGITIPENPVALINLRIAARGKTQKPPMEKRIGRGEYAKRSERRVFFIGYKDAVTATVFDGDALSPGSVIEGPAIIEFPTTTVLVEPSMKALVDDFGNIRIAVGGRI